MAQERLQKLLARAGIASRRAAEELIVEGRVSVDGKIVRELGARADGRRQRVEVDGRKIVSESLVYLILNKPRGVMCTLSDPEGRKTIKELVRGAGARVVPVGRLDYHTSGALLLTNDGDFALELQHPRGKVPKEYVAKVRGVLDEKKLARFAESIEIDGRRTQPADVRLLRLEGDKTWISIILREGKNRQVRRLGDEAGHPVLRLSRLSHAGITTEGLRPGEWRPLSKDELTTLKKTYGVPKRVHAPAPPPERTARDPRPERKRPERPQRSDRLRPERPQRPERPGFQHAPAGAKKARPSGSSFGDAFPRNGAERADVRAFRPAGKTKTKPEIGGRRVEHPKASAASRGGGPRPSGRRGTSR